MQTLYNPQHAAEESDQVVFTTYELFFGTASGSCFT